MLTLDKIDPELDTLIAAVANGRLEARVIDTRVFKIFNGKIISEIHIDKIKTNRNDPCICGSGKKYKKCCLKGK